MSKFKEDDKIKCNGEFGSVVCYYSDKMIEVRLPGGVCCVDECDAVPVITRKQFNKISTDYRGVWHDHSNPEWLNKRTCFSGCLYNEAGTTILIEDFDFIILN